MSTFEKTKLGYAVRKQFAVPGFTDHFKHNVQFVTQPFYEAYWKARNKLRDVVVSTKHDTSGTFVIKWPNHTQTIFYRLLANGDKDNWDFDAFICMLTKTAQGDSFGLDLLGYIGKEKKEYCDVVWKGFTDQGRNLTYWISDLMMFCTFLKYADVETKIVNGHKKEKHNGEKYVNDTKGKIEILDSTYFTTISRTEGFGVDGFFRMQPCGPGLSQRRLQWIPGFQKHGYTRTAKVLKTDTN